MGPIFVGLFKQFSRRLDGRGHRLKQEHACTVIPGKYHPFRTALPLSRNQGSLFGTWLASYSPSALNVHQSHPAAAAGPFVWQK